MVCREYTYTVLINAESELFLWGNLPQRRNKKMEKGIEVQRRPKESHKNNVYMQYLLKLEEMQKDPTATSESNEVSDDDIKL